MSDKEKGAIGRALDEAKPIRAQKQPSRKTGAGKKGNEVSVPQSSQSSQSPSPTGPSTREKLLAIVRGNDTAQSLQQTLQEARELVASQELVDGFVGMMEEADDLADYKRHVEMDDDDAEDLSDWEERSWDEKFTKLRDWAKTDSQVEEAVNRIDAFLSANKTFASFLINDLAEKFLSKLNQVEVMDDLRDFLDEACDHGWVECFRNPHWEEENCVEIVEKGNDRRRSNRLVYVPAKTRDRKEKPVVARAWPYVLKTFERVSAFQSSLDELQGRADPGLTPKKVSKGEEGYFVVRPTKSTAILLEAFSEGEYGMHVRVVGSVGCDESRLPSDSAKWNALENRPAPQTGWRFIIQGTNRRYFSRRQKERRDEWNEFISPIYKNATFATDLKDMGLTRILIKGENGVAPFILQNFGWNQKNGTLGVAIRHDNGSYFLDAMVSTRHRVSEGAIGIKLFLVIGADKVSLSKDVGVQANVLDSLKMAVLAINRRLKQEARFDQNHAEDSADKEESEE